MFGSVQVHAATIYANYSTGNDSTGDGSAGSPYKTFYKAYTVASASDTLDLTGTFDWSNADETGDASVTGFTLNKTLTIQGHGADKTIIQAASAPNTAGKRVFTLAVGTGATFKDLTIRYGYNSGTESPGTAIYAQYSNSPITIINCWIDQNKNHTDRYVNGAIYSRGDLIVRNSTISNNENGYAGGIYFTGTNAEITNSTFYNNYGEYYGGFFDDGTTATVTNSTFANNKGTNSCADVCPWYSTLYIKNTIMADKQTGASNFDPGNSTIHDNGYNIVETQNGSSFTNGVNGDLVGNQASLNVDSGLAINSSSNGVPTLATLSSSVAIDAGDPNDGANNGISVPISDERYFYRNGRTDIGAFENSGSSTFSRPTTPASNVTFSSVAYGQMTASWANGNGMRRVVFMKQASSGTASPVDSTTYSANATFGSGTQIGTSGWYAVYNGSGTSATISGLSPSTDYIVEVMEYSGGSGEELYYAGTGTNNPNTQTTTSVTEPTTQASVLTFSSVGYTSMTASWTNGDGEKRAVFVRQASSGTVSPVDGTTYSANATFGSGTQIGTSGWYCVYNGTGTSVNVSGLSAQTDYIFQVFEYSGTSGIENYYTVSATGNPAVQASATVTEPTTQAYNVSFSTINASYMYVNWTVGNGNRRVVFVKQASSGTASPADDTYYSASTTFGSGTQIGTSGWYAVYNGTSSGTYVFGLSANTDYIVEVFEYNYSGSVYNYLTSSATNNPKVQMTAASQPNTQASAVSFSSVATTSMTVSWTAGNGNDRAVFAKAVSSGTAIPADDTTYAADTAFGNGAQIGTSGWYCVYNGTGTSVDVTGLTLGTDYTFQVFEYNGAVGNENYYTASATGNPATQATVGNYTLTYVVGAHGSLTGDTSQMVSPGGDGTTVTAVPDSGYHFINWSDSSTDNPRIDTNVNADVNVTANFSDTDAPVISSVSSTPSDTSADISWTTNEASSSQVEYGLTSSYGTSTTEADTSTRVTSHAVSLSGLQSCASYHYRVKSKDASNNQVISSDGTFSASGCDTSSVSSGSGESVLASGGSVSISTDDGSASLDAPSGYTSTDLTIEINKLNASSAPAAPSGNSLVGDNFFNFLAVDGSGNVVDTFDKDITLTIHYGSATTGSYVESTLGVYKYAGGSWTDKNCTLDTSAKTLTCFLPSFSTYAVLGQPIPESSSSFSHHDERVDLKLTHIKYKAVSPTEIRISWRTNNNADEKVYYGTDKQLKEKETNNQKGHHHVVHLKNLSAGQKYYFRASSDDGEQSTGTDVYSLALSGDGNVSAQPSIETPRRGVSTAADAIPVYTGDAKPNACSYAVRDGDNLWSIAKKVYGDATAYPLIIKANQEKYPDVAAKLSIGQELVFDDCQNK